jgi:hypothetical protein
MSPIKFTGTNASSGFGVVSTDSLNGACAAFEKFTAAHPSVSVETCKLDSMVILASRDVGRVGCTFSVLDQSVVR